ncbi:MAG: serine/threonine protein kinase [Deltaproteobacteria bacterium]|nr:serine/threonine protein kinase [Deltaproteobacteria bacterium]
MTGDDDANAWSGETRPEASLLPVPAAPAEQLGPYTLTKRLAAGGMAEVYLAELLRPGGFKKTLVVKRILPQLAGDARYLELFLREGRTSAQLNHPNVVQVFELGEAGGSYYLAMEYVDGLTLSDLARRTWFSGKPLPLDVVAACVADAALGLACAHDNSLVHRDVSPDNLMVSREGITKVVDFGIARPQSNDRITQTGELKGKIPYMAPEYLAGNTADPRCDIYALGVTLYWLMTGVRPFRGNSTLEEMEAIQRKVARPPRELNPRIPETVQALTLACLEKDPGRRPQSARNIAETLMGVTPSGREHVSISVKDAMALPQPPRGQALKDGLPATVTGHEATITLAGAPTSEATGRTMTVSARAKPAPRALLAASGVALVIVVAALGGWLAWRGGAAPALTEQRAEARDLAREVAREVAPLVVPVEAEAAPSEGGDDVAAGAERAAVDEQPADRLIASEALPRGVVAVRGSPTTQVYLGAKLLGTAPLKTELVAGTWRLRCVTGKVEELKRVTLQPGAVVIVDCTTAPPLADRPAAAPPASHGASEQRRAEAKRASDGNDWLRSDGVLELRGDTLSWTPTGLSVGHQTLTLRLKDVANVSGRDDDLTVTTSWGARYRFTVADAAGWSRAVAAGRDRYRRQ